MDLTTAAVEHALHAHVLAPPFPCLGAKAALHQQAATVRAYADLDTRAGIIDLAADLAEFSARARPGHDTATTFVAAFGAPACPTLPDLARVVWTTLRRLRLHDRAPWAAGYSADPAASDFAYSFGSVAYFVATLSPANPRLARRFPWPTLVFNPHHQFDTLRARGVFERMVRMIRARDAALQGGPNPLLAHFGAASEAPQYVGVLPDDADLLAPFAP